MRFLEMLAGELQLTELEAEQAWADRDALRRLVQSAGFRALSLRRMYRNLRSMKFHQALGDGEQKRYEDIIFAAGQQTGRAEEAAGLVGTLEAYLNAMENVHQQWLEYEEGVRADQQWLEYEEEVRAAAARAAANAEGGNP